MRACVRNDNGDSSEGFIVERELRHGCVLSRWLFNIFLADVFLVVLQRFNEELDILADQEQPARAGPETAMECARRAV